MKHDPIWRLATFLEAFDIRTAYPLLLMLLDVGLDESEWKAISTVVESFLLRRAVCRLNTQNYNRVFLSLTKNLRKEGVSVEALSRLLLSQSGESSGWPTDSAFKDAWLGKPAYELGNAKLVHILSRLNETFFSEKAELIIFERQLTIEHIMPQEWSEYWPLPDGQRGMDASELFLARDDDPRAVATDERNRAIQNIGNLTILSRALNSAQSNSAWQEKRTELMKHSLLPINQVLNDAKKWDEQTIAVRAEELFAKALIIWPHGKRLAAVELRS